MKVLLFFIICVIICYIHVTSSEPTTTNKPKATKEKSKTSTKNAGANTAKPKDKNKEFAKKTADHKGKSKVNMKNADDHASKSKAKKTPTVRTPFDKVLEKLSNCAATNTLSPSIAEVMEENLKEIQSDEKYVSLFIAAPHTAAFLKKKKKDSTKFIGGLRQALHADWSNPAWKSYNEIDTLFRPLKQQFVYTMMRFNCT